MSTPRSPPVWGPLVDFDKRRTREFYSYYEPFSTLFSERASYVDLHDGYAVEQHKPRASPDKALTALCQLVAVQLRVRRAMLFFFDEHYGYILAESTKSLSLQSDNPYLPGDTLWLGFSVIPKGFSVCEHTSRIPFGEMYDVNTPATNHMHIINDLRNDARFSNRPYVTADPCARFYAGAPIVTPQGVPIGALCALDHEPRNGLSDVDAEFLQDMATTIMQHFESIKARAEYKRGTHMISGLSAFMRGMNSDQSKHNSDYVDVTNAPSTRGSNAAPPMGQQQIRCRNRDRHARTSVEHDNIAERATSQRDSYYPYVLASSLIRKALDIDGVLFLDAAINTFGGIVHGPRRVSLNDDSTESQTLSERELNTGGSIVHTETSKGADTAACPVLAAAHKEGVDADLRPLSQSRLRSLCRRYPRGKIWVFDGRRDPLASERSSGTGVTLESGDTDGASTRRRRNRHVPIRDHTTGLWRAGAVLYTRSATRTFSHEGELAFLAAFCDVVVAELARAESQASFEAKTGFMSSISHELRTPLHGILGTAEQLHDELSQGLATRMLNQIEVCGRTLLDVVDHLLDFTTLNQDSRGFDPYAANAQMLGERDGNHNTSAGRDADQKFCRHSG
nr:hybrid signal transduction histidine kinase b [Quercus suber]